MNSAAASLDVTLTVPRYPATTLPEASNAVTVSVVATAGSTVAGNPESTMRDATGGGVATGAMVPVNAIESRAWRLPEPSIRTSTIAARYAMLSPRSRTASIAGAATV